MAASITVLKMNTVPLSSQAVPEFLYQLTMMLLKENSDILEWRNGQIVVHSPLKLADDILHKYFRLSKYSSFQRQLNYFGFRKLRSKGKMAPCVYVNEDATNELESLILIKRKTGKKRCRNVQNQEQAESGTPVKIRRSCEIESVSNPTRCEGNERAYPLISSSPGDVCTSNSMLVKVAEGNNHFDAASFCASLNTAIRERSIFSEISNHRDQSAGDFCSLGKCVPQVIGSMEKRLCDDFVNDPSCIYDPTPLSEMRKRWNDFHMSSSEMQSNLVSRLI